MSDELDGAETTTSDETQLDTLRETIDDPVVLKAQLAKEAEARRQLTARAKKAEETAKSERELRIKAEEGNQNSSITNQPSTPVEDERLELRFQGHSKEDVDFIMANGGTKILENPNSIVSIALKAKSEQAKAEAAAAQTGQSSGEDQFRETNFNLPKDPSVKDLKASLALMEKALPHAD